MADIQSESGAAGGAAAGGTAAGGGGTSGQGPNGADPAFKAGFGDYAFLTFLTLLNVMNFVDRQLLASFANFIVPDLGLTNTQFGLLTGFLFIVFYAVMGLCMGALADMLHRPRLIAAGLAMWSVFTALSGAAKGFVSLAIPRMMIGIGESVLTPTAMSILADRFPSERLGFAAGFYYMGVPLGVGVSLLVAGYLGPAIGWRNCFYLLGGIGVLLAIVLLFVKETPRRQHGPAVPVPDEGSVPPVPRQSFGQILSTLFSVLSRSPALSLTVAGGVATHFILGAAAFDQLWLVQERGFERGEIARISGFLALVGGILGNLCGGLMSDWWQRTMGTGRTMFLFWALLLLTPLNLAFRIVEPGWLFFFAYGAAFFQLGIFYGPTFSTVQELVPPQIRATVVAFYILMLNVVGLGFGISAGGILVDYLISRGVEEPYTVTLLIFTGLSALAMPLFYFAGRRYHQDRERLYQDVA